MLGHVGSNQVVVGQRVERLASRELLDATSQMLDATELEPPHRQPRAADEPEHGTDGWSGESVSIRIWCGTRSLRTKLARGMNPIQLADVLEHSSLRMIQGTYDPLAQHHVQQHPPTGLVVALEGKRTNNDLCGISVPKAAAAGPR